MNYQVPQHIDKEKIFIVNRSEIEGRLDPHYNKPEYLELMQILSSIREKIKITTIKKNSCVIFSGITPKSGGDAYVQHDGIPFVRSGDFSDTNEIDFSQLLLLRKDVHNTIMKGSQLIKNDLLIAIVGATIGKIGVYDYDTEANINQAICAVRLKENLNPFYVQAFFQTNIGQKIIERVKRPVARANINLEEVGNLPVPLLKKQQQEIIVKIMENGRSLKRKKEQEAQQLLDSIDTYLINELGITLPEVSFKLHDRIFFSSYKKLIGNRIDPLFALCWGKNAKSSLYDIINLHTIADIFKGNALTSEGVIPGSIPVIAGGQTSPYSHNEANYEGNVITVSASGAYAGYVWYHQNPIYATDCSVIRSKDESQFLTEYIFEVLKVQQRSIYWLQTGAAQPHVYASDLASLIIPDIPLTKQREIVSYISTIRQQVKALQEEGKNILEQAKKEVESMIIG